MNTKGIKFLAVLAVMVMAFAAVIVLAPADNDVEAVKVYNNPAVKVDPTVIEADMNYDQFYISDDATVKVKGLKYDVVTFYVQNGKELELNIKGDFESTKTIKIYSVTSDQQRVTTSTVDKGAGEETDTVEGKIKLMDTEVVFKVVNPDDYSTVNQSVVYNSMMPYKVTTQTTSGSNVKTDVWTSNWNADSFTRPYTQKYATISSDAVLDATIAKYVTVAPGQFIQTTGLVDMDYGVLTVIGVANDTEYTYYARGMNAGTIDLVSGDYVDVKDGSAIGATVNNTANVKVTNASAVKLEWSTDNAIAVSGTLSVGTITASGSVVFDSAFANYSTVTLNGSAIATGYINNGGTLVLKNEAKGIIGLNVTGTGTVVAQNEKLWEYGTGTDPVIQFANPGAFHGQFDVYAITKVAEVKDAFSTAEIKKNQTFDVVADTIVTTSLKIEGVLIIEPGVTLTISKINGIGAAVTSTGQYAQIINYGEILIQSTAPDVDPTATNATINDFGLHVHGGLFANNGKVIGSSDTKALATGMPSLCVKFGETGYGAGFINYGTITTSRNDTVSLDANFVNEGSVSINGTLDSTGLKNKGVFTLNNAKIGSSLNVNMQSKGAVFTIGSAEVASNATITISNKSGENVFTVKAPSFDSGKCSIRGITVTDASTKLDISGTFAVSKPASTSESGIADVQLITAGSIEVSSSVVIGKGFVFDFTADTTLTVPGVMTVSKDAAKATPATGSGLTLKVTGLVTCVGDDQFQSAKKFVAAKLEVGSDTIYTSLENAVATATLADVTVIEVGGDKKSYVTVTDDIVVPEGMTITGDYLVVDKMATIAVENNAMFSFETVVVKDGMITAEDANNINPLSIKADVKVEDDESTSAACMSLNVALMLATEGDVIELSQEYVGTDIDLVIPAGVTVDATAADNTDFVLINSNLVVDGILVVNTFKFIATTDDTIGITVNGYIYDEHSNGGCFAPWWYVPFGVSYQITDEENDKVWYVLTSIENIQPAINVADDAKVAVEGDAVLDELTVSGRDDMPAEVTFNGDVDIGAINIDEVTLIFTKDTEIDTTVRNAVGSITITGGYVDSYLSIYDMAIYSSEDVGVYMEGVVTDRDVGTYSILFEGITGMDGTDTRTSISWTSNEEVPTILFDGVTTVIGKKAYIQFEDEVLSTGMATITGTLLVDYNSKIIINSDVQILGGLVAMDRTDDAIGGAVDISGNVFVGALESDIYDLKDGLNAYKEDKEYDPTKLDNESEYGECMYLGDAAILSGNIEIAKGYFITAMSGSVIDPQIVEDLDYMDIVIEDTVWLTVYAYSDDWYSMDGLKAPIFNAKVTTIVDVDGNPVAKYNHNYKVIYGCEPKRLSQFGNAVIINLNYDVFTVEIKTDGSVKAVYIDGILMRTGFDENIFTLEKVATGTHKVTVEAATGYDASKCVLYTEMGTILPGMAFTFTEFDCEDYVVTYNLNGTEIQPEPVPPTPEEESQWTITTILLVILVVLIAIMAVIVALRLNRS